MIKKYEYRNFIDLCEYVWKSPFLFWQPWDFMKKFIHKFQFYLELEI